MSKIAPRASQSVPNTYLEKLFDNAVGMAQDPEAVEKTFMARYLLQCTLPHSDPGDVSIWTRKSGALTLTVVPYIDRDTMKPLYPYGTLPRLLLYWIVTEAARTKNRRLFLGASLTTFIHKLKLDPTSGGKRGVPKRLRKQMTRLLRSKISIEKRGGASYAEMQISSAGQLWWTPNGSSQGDLFESWIDLGDEFYRAIVDGPVPVDRRALLMLKKSSLALDLYGWIVAKTWQANHTAPENLGLPISWEQLYGQMGSEYATVKNFKAKVKSALVKVKMAYPKMKVQVDGNGILVLPAPTPIPELE